MRMQSSTAGPGWLLERETALERLRSIFAAARAGRCGLVVVSGAAGVGKSTLLGVAEREARERGWQVLSARGDELERDFPFGVAIQLFAAPILARAEREPELLAGAAVLARPLLEHADADFHPGDPDPGFPLLHGLHWLAVNLAERAALLLSVDDAQWADAPTLRYLHYLWQRGEGLRLALLLAKRTGEPLDPECVKPIEGLEADPSAESIELRALGLESVRELVRRRLPDADEVFVAACFEATGGNPFLLGELLQAAVHEQVADAAGLRALHPDSVRRSAAVRLARLGEAATRLGRAAALLGAAPLDVVADLAGLDADAAAAAADLLIAARILDAGERLAFLHPLLRDAVYEAIPPASQRVWHAAAARLLHERGAASTALATHLALCDPIGEAWVVPALRDAARVALGGGAVTTALAHLKRALREPGRERDPEVLLELGTAEAGAGDPAWEGHLEGATKILSDPDQRRRGLAALGYGRWVQGDPAGAVEAVQTALAEIPPGEGGSPEADLLLSFYLAGRFVPSLVRSVREQLAVERLGPGGVPTPGEVARRCLAAFDAVMEGRPAAAVELARSPLAWMSSDPSLAVRVPPLVRVTTATGLALAGLYREAERAIEPVLELAQRTGNRLLLGAALEQRIFVRYQRGELRGALADAQTSLELCDRWDVASTLTRGLLSWLLLERGVSKMASEAFALPTGVEVIRRGTHGHFWVPRIRAWLALARGEWAEALAQALLLGEQTEAIDAGSPDWQPWRSLAAQAAHGLGQRERALALVREELALARSIGSARATGVALTTLGRVEGGVSGIESLREAVDLLDATEAQLEQVRARLALGMALRHHGQRREARTILKEVADRARAMGATATAESAVTELRIAGGRPRRFAAHGQEALTPSQLRIAELAASGHSNKEIAQSLFITLRTVETHLTEVYRRLEIPSREKLAQALWAGGAGGLPEVADSPAGWREAPPLPPSRTWGRRPHPTPRTH